MNRRRFIASLSSIGLTAAGWPARGQAVAKRFADMHTHLGFRSELSPREALARGGMLLVAEKIAPDGMVKQFGAQHVGVGTDMYGLPRSVVPTYEEFARLADLLPPRGLKAEEVDAVLGGNYLRVLREALSI